MTGIIGGIARSKLLLIPIPIPPEAEQHRIVAKVDELMALCDELEVQQEQSVTLTRNATASALHHLCEADNVAETKSNWSILSNNFTDWFNDLGALKKLRAATLQLAVQGNLAPQNPNDEHANVLVERVRAEKRRLLAEGVIRKSKPVQPIDVGNVPFELPDGWVWVRLGDLVDPRRPISYGVIKLGPDWPGGIKTIRCSNVKFRSLETSSVREISPDIARDYQRTSLLGGEVVMNIRGTLGGCAIIPPDMVGANIAREVAMIVPAEGISARLILDVISSPLIQEETFKNLRGIAYKGLNLGILSEFLFPLPPAAEQIRIAAKIDELMSLFYQLDNQIRRSQSLNRDLFSSLVHSVTTQQGGI